jgi:hypothetical protein
LCTQAGIQVLAIHVLAIVVADVGERFSANIEMQNDNSAALSHLS